jgi:hypothetical protein
MQFRPVKLVLEINTSDWYYLQYIMLGIGLIICLAAFWLVKLKAYTLSHNDPDRPLLTDADVRIYTVNRRAVLYEIISLTIIFAGYALCAWPYLFIKDVDRIEYYIGVAMFGIGPLFIFTYILFFSLKAVQDYIRISADEIEYKKWKLATIKIDDISRIDYMGLSSFQIHFKIKSRHPTIIHLNNFHCKTQLCAEFHHLSDCINTLSGQNKIPVLRFLRRFNATCAKYFSPVFNIVLTFLLLYSSYCCIDYDFFRPDYMARFNTLNSDPNQHANAWDYYVQAAAGYKSLNDKLQSLIDESKSGRIDFNDVQKSDLRQWLNDNTSSWTNLKKAASIDYCNSHYERLSLLAQRTDRRDFSSPYDTGYGQIKHLYFNASTCCNAGILNISWLDLFKMQLASSKHFINGKTFVDQLVGYGMLAKSIKLFTEQRTYSPQDLQNVRAMLKKYFPTGLPSLNLEGEILEVCSSITDLINIKEILVQTPLNPEFFVFGSPSGTEAYARKHFNAALEQARTHIEYKLPGFSITFPIFRNELLKLSYSSVPKVYEISQRAIANLCAAYVIVDLEQYHLTNGCYPADAFLFAAQLADDSDALGHKIIYRNDGHRAVLYAVGPNGKDDGGFKDEKQSAGKRDDIIFWERSIK